MLNRKKESVGSIGGSILSASAWHQERFNVTPATLVEDPEGITIIQLARDIAAAGAPTAVLQRQQPALELDDGGLAELLKASAQSRAWIAPAPILIRARLFCFAPEGSVGEHFFAR